MFEAIRSPLDSGSIGTDKIMHLTFPVAAGHEASHASPRAAAALALEGRYLTLPNRAAVTEAHPIPAQAADETWQVRVDMTLADAEDLVEGLRSLIAAAKARLPEQDTARATALALAGLKISAEPKAAPPRLSHAQLEALGRMPIRRSLDRGPDGMLFHALGTPATLQPKSAGIAR